MVRECGATSLRPTVVKNDGKRLEAKFGVWLATERGYEVTLRRQVRGAIAVRPYEVDVAGTLTRRWAFWLAMISISGCIVWLVMTVWSHMNGGGEDAGGAYWAWVEFGLFVAMISGTYLWREHVWVECKDVKNGISRDQVLKLRQSVGDVKKYGLGWKPRRVYMVTANRFQQDALALANSFGFVCYEEAEDGFRPVSSPPAR